jgi:hypothetical protein
MALDAHVGVTLRYAEGLRRYCWDKCPIVPRPPDYDHVAKAYPADPSGECRHKVSYLQRYLGGEVLIGRRTDQGSHPELHAVLAVRFGTHLIVVDHDGLWPWPAFRKRWKPEVHEPTPPPEPKPLPARGSWYSHKG